MTQQSAPYYYKDTNCSPTMVDIRRQQDNDLMMGSFEEAFTDTDNMDWEDEEEEPRYTQQERRSQTTSYLPRSSPRKRKGTQSSSHGRRKTRPASPRPVPASPPPQVELPSIISREEVLHGTLETGVYTLQYLWGIARIVFKLAYWPLSVMATLLLLSFIVARMSDTIRSALSPLCIVPGVSSSAWCRPIISVNTQEVKWADFPKLMEVQDRTFGNLMTKSSGTSILSLDIKNAEMATKDLVVVVKHSDLKAKSSVVSILTEFLKDAKTTSEGLGRLNAKVMGAVDSIMASNDYTINSIDAARASQPTVWSMGAVVPWMKPKKTLNEVVKKSFENAMDYLSKQMERLIFEATVNLQNLNRLEEHLMTLHDAVHREDSSISTAKNELLADLWTHLGWNKDKIRNFDKNLNILKGLKMYREEAKNRIVETLHILQTMQHDMEEMRERVVESDVLGSSIPIEVHMKSIRIGLQRLKDGRITSQRLEAERLQKFGLAQGFVE